MNRHSFRRSEMGRKFYASSHCFCALHFGCFGKMGLSNGGIVLPRCKGKQCALEVEYQHITIKKQESGVTRLIQTAHTSAGLSRRNARCHYLRARIAEFPPKTTSRCCVERFVQVLAKVRPIGSLAVQKTAYKGNVVHRIFAGVELAVLVGARDEEACARPRQAPHKACIRMLIAHAHEIFPARQYGVKVVPIGSLVEHEVCEQVELRIAVSNVLEPVRLVFVCH